MLLYYVSGIFRNEKRPVSKSEKVKRNPLQRSPTSLQGRHRADHGLDGIITLRAHGGMTLKTVR